VMGTMSALASQLAIKFKHFQVVADLDHRRYVLHLEPVMDVSPERLCEVLTTFERELGIMNENYAQFRTDRLIGAPAINVTRQGLFDRLSSEPVARTGRDSQFKPAVLGSNVEHPDMVESKLDFE